MLIFAWRGVLHLAESEDVITRMVEGEEHLQQRRNRTSEVLMLKLTGASLKTKAAFAVAALLCVITPCLTISCSHPYTCTLEDISTNPKCMGNVVGDIERLNLSSNDDIALFLYFDHELNEGEIEAIAKCGATIREDSWIPPVDTHPYGFYAAHCKVGDICNVVDLDIVKQFTSGEGTAYFNDVTQP